MKFLSNDNMSTGLGDRLYSSNILFASNPENFHIPSSGRKLISSSCLEFSIIDPNVEKMGFVVNG